MLIWKYLHCNQIWIRPLEGVGMQETVVTAIEAMLTPAIGISAVGLLLLSLSNRYSSIINRLRLLNDEKRRFSRQLVEQGNLGDADNARFISIAKQTDELLARSRYVRNAILSMQTAIGLFVLTSVTIALNLFSSADILKLVPLVMFITGMLAVFVGILFAGVEIYRSYTIVLIEARGVE